VNRARESRDQLRQNALDIAAAVAEFHGGRRYCAS
jgi:hypothetical protein